MSVIAQLPRVDTSDRPFGLPPDDEPGVIQFTVPGDVVPWARAGRGGGFTFTPAKQRNYMAVLKDYASQALGDRPVIENAVFLRVTAVYAVPKSWSKKRREHPGHQWKTSRPDADNISKIVKDALNTVVWRDDAQVVKLTVEKFYGERPRVDVVIREIGRTA